MRPPRSLKPLITLAVLASLGLSAYATREHWLHLMWPAPHAEGDEEPDEAAAPARKVIVTEQVQQNLGLTAAPLKAGTFWRTIPVPGMVVDRPGLTDRGIVAPATGVVAKIHHVPGDILRPGETLFTLKLQSEALHLTQSDLFKSVQNIKLAQAQRKRLVDSNAVSPASITEVDSQITRLEVAVKAYRQELLARGLSLELIDGVSEGKFASDIAIVAPPAPISSAEPSTLELEELKVELGQQVQAGQALCRLANHRLLAIEGRAFRDESPLLEKTVLEKWPVEVDFQEDAAAGWGDVKQTFHIRHIANTIDPIHRTFAFTIPLENPFRTVKDEGHVQTLWRFRPGQKVRLLIRVEQMQNVYVLPAEAVALEWPEAFVFTQNVNTFERKPVRVLFQDRRQVVVANDGSLASGSFVVQSGAAQLNRMVKAAGSGGVPKGYHIHADGSVHKNEDDEK